MKTEGSSNHLKYRLFQQKTEQYQKQQQQQQLNINLAHPEQEYGQKKTVQSLSKDQEITEQYIAIQKRIEELQIKQQKELEKQQQQILEQTLRLNEEKNKQYQLYLQDKSQQKLKESTPCEEPPKQSMMYSFQHHKADQPAKPFHFRHAQAQDGEKEHAYFPAPHPKHDPPVERIVHNSAAYNYGLPNSPRKENKSRTSKRPHSKICVCVRKRPMVAKEVKRGEVDVVKTGKNSTVIVKEPKVSLDLRKYTQLVRISVADILLAYWLIKQNHFHMLWKESYFAGDGYNIASVHCPIPFHVT